MKQRLLALVLSLCLGLLAGCGPDLAQYPHVTPEPPVTEPRTLTIDLPSDADALTQEAVSRFAAAVLELSDGAVTLEVIPSDRPAVALENGSTNLALLTNSMLIDLDPTLSFLDWPFLASNPQQYLTVMGAEDGAVRSSQALREALGGEVIGLWYGGRTVLLGRGIFYEEICFSGSSVGVMSNRFGSGLFTEMNEALRAKGAVYGTPDELLPLLEEKTVKYLEYPLSALDPEALPASVKYLEDTGHRLEAFWLAVNPEGLDPHTVRLLKAAAAYVPAPALEAREAAEQAVLDRMISLDVKVKQEGYEVLHRAAREYYRKNHLQLGCTQRTWEKLLPGLF